jgi:hypothetical protein
MSSKSIYCDLCALRQVCPVKGTCHALRFVPLGDGKTPIPQLYVPKEAEGSFALFIASSDHFRPLDRSDLRKIGAIVVVVIVSGNRPRMSFKGYQYYRADIGAVGDHFADVWLKERIVSKPEGLPDLCGPLRAGIASGRLFILGYK